MSIHEHEGTDRTPPLCEWDDRPIRKYQKPPLRAAQQNAKRAGPLALFLSGYGLTRRLVAEKRSLATEPFVMGNKSEAGDRSGHMGLSCVEGWTILPLHITRRTCIDGTLLRNYRPPPPHPRVTSGKRLTGLVHSRLQQWVV